MPYDLNRGKANREREREDKREYIFERIGTMKMPENEISYYDQVHPFHHPAAATSIMQHHTGASPAGPYPSLQFPSAFVAFQTSPAAAHIPTANTANLLEHHAHLHRQQQHQQQQQAAGAFGSSQTAGLGEQKHRFIWNVDISAL